MTPRALLERAVAALDTEARTSADPARVVWARLAGWWLLCLLASEPGAARPLPAGEVPPGAVPPPASGGEA
jgi:hypothetical protein